MWCALFMMFLMIDADMTSIFYYIPVSINMKLFNMLKEYGWMDG